MNLIYEVGMQFATAIISSSILSAYYLLQKGINSYCTKFAFTMVAVSFLMVGILNSVGGSIAVSISLFGALSLLRFRSIVRDIDDMAFLFVSLASGLAAGTGNFIITVVVVACFILICYIFNFLQRHETDKDVVWIEITAHGSVSSKIILDSVSQLNLPGLKIVSVFEDFKKSINKYKFKCSQSEEQVILVVDQLKLIHGLIQCKLTADEE